MMPSISRIVTAYLSKQACIIAVGEWGGKKCLLKNRDRNYVPKVKIIHEVRDGVEVLYMTDVITGWCEGLNEHGIGVVNSALQVARDEAEKNVIKSKGKKSKDGPRVLKVLECTSIEQALEAGKTFEGGLKGHTIIADQTRTYALEGTSKHEYHARKLPEGKITVRTNHGIHYDDSGYTEGPNYESSVVRRDKAKKTLRDLDSPDEVATALMAGRMDDRAHPNNMVRYTDNMSTTSQMVLNLTDKELVLYVIPKRVEFEGYENKLPKGRKPKLKVRVVEYVDVDGDGDFDVKAVKL
jgi:hypothetical protein